MTLQPLVDPDLGDPRDQAPLELFESSGTHNKKQSGILHLVLITAIHVTRLLRAIASKHAQVITLKMEGE